MSKIEKGHSAYLKAYIRLNKRSLESELNYLKKCKTLIEVIERSTKALKSNGQKSEHQKRIKNKTLQTMSEKLQQREKDFKKSKDFEEIMKIVEEEKMSGFGKLAIYDTSLKIGARLNIRPKYIYLHAGTKKGVRSLGISVKKKDKIHFEELPIVFKDAIQDGSLTEMHLEDLFCIYKERLK
jgi:hypothetical protein